MRQTEGDVMMTTSDSVHYRPTNPALRTVVVVGEADERVLDTVADTGSYDVVVVEPMSSAYSKIKRIVPSTIIMCMSLDDIEACQVISMLKLDQDTAGIPVVTCVVH
jgi:CheY-like chemotaxis protein